MTIPITQTTPYGPSYTPPPPAAQPTASPTTQAPDSGAAKEPVDNSGKIWGKDGFTFGSVLATINPLQHIPVVGAIYRAVTGDEIGPAPRMIGDALYGGVAGLIVSAVDVAVEAVTGKDMGANVAALIKGDSPGDTQLAAKDGTPTTDTSPTGEIAAQAAQATPPADPAAAQIADASNPTAGIDSVIAAALPPPPAAAKPPQTGQQIAAASATPDKPVSNNDTGSSAVGTGAKSLPSAVAPPPPPPDVMSTNMRHAPKQQYYTMHGSGSGRAGLTSYDPTLFEARPTAPTPVAASASSGSTSSGSGGGNSSLAPASPPAQASATPPAADPDNNWFSQAMSRGLDKYSQIQSGPPASPQVDIAR